MGLVPGRLKNGHHWPNSNAKFRRLRRGTMQRATIRKIVMRNERKDEEVTISRVSRSARLL